MDSLWVARAWRKQVDHQQMNSLPDEIGALLHEGAQFVATSLIAGRDDLQDGYNVSMSVPYCDSVGSFRVEIGLASPHESGPGRSRQDRSRRCPVLRQVRPWREFQAQNVCNRTVDILFEECKIVAR